MTQTASPQGMSGPFANIYNRLGLAWWVEVTTAQPECIYYFGPFLTANEAQKAMPGYVEDLKQENATGIDAVVKRCKPTEVTICKE